MNTDTPRTNEALVAILERDGELSEKNAPEALVKLCRAMECKVKELNHQLARSQEAADRLEELQAQLQEAQDYANRLVAHKNMLCLPKDLQNLRSVNSQFAAENHILKEQMRILESSKNQITWT
jgi:hypothetical protein